ncbi:MULTISPECIES: acyl-CoA dehydrogenase family protein [unclassified Nocardioides]|uniref:acyl-CoA dehydrogenase family protein n=1 Tax=unclassified Nocardioides TaxID=2615069 RepID=UPI0009EFBFE6|nr:MULTISPECIES: acyl-CoA dehydrogenase family protein [unclassified Nocardioides]GAW49604.1 Acyl-CoA dehydrogenase domain-containing protein [Nocardioides sp. PD653-B2]GAW57556.1 Acyl-CoA dehydrogenase domain-containing protein [Nocardioides sp. PD653]
MDFSQHPEVAAWIAKAEALKPIFAERARRYDEAGSWPKENMDLLFEQGFLKLAIPAEFGGLSTEAGFAHILPHSVIEIIASACASTAWALTTQYHCHGLIAGLASHEQQSWLFKEVLDNGALMATVGSEVVPAQRVATGTESGTIQFNVEFRKTEDGFVANGTKGFTSGAAASTFILYWALAPNTETPSEGLVLGVMRADDPGVQFLPGWEEVIGIRASLSGPTKFDNVPIPNASVLGQPGDYVQKHPYLFEITYATICLGIAQGAFDFVVKVFNERPYLAEEDSLKYTLGEMSSALQATRASWWYAQWLYDTGRFGEGSLAALRALHQAKTTGMFVVTKAFDVVGTRALFKFNPLERAWRDLRTVSLHTRESQLMGLVAKAEITGDRFAKAKYGYRIAEEQRKNWSELGFPELDR